jgi:Spy/CpxP family protein refolding chaperone
LKGVDGATPDRNGYREQRREADMKARLFALLLFCASGMAVAQSPPDRPPGPPPNAEHQLDRLSTLLDLTDTQKAQVKAILDAQHAKMKVQFQTAQASGTRPTFEEMRAAHQQSQAETVQQLTPVLTPSQLKKFQVLTEEEHGPHGHGPHGPPSGDAPPPASN